VPPHGTVKKLDLPPPWGAILQLSIDRYRILFDVYDTQDTVEVVLVFEKPDHIDTIEAMLRWFGESTLPERRRQ
jgi:hypothetical protein